MNKTKMLKWVRVDEFKDFTKDLDQLINDTKKECAEDILKMLDSKIDNKKKVLYVHIYCQEILAGFR